MAKRTIRSPSHKTKTKTTIHKLRQQCVPDKNWSVSLFGTQRLFLSRIQTIQEQVVEAFLLFGHSLFANNGGLFGLLVLSSGLGRLFGSNLGFQCGLVVFVAFQGITAL